MIALDTQRWLDEGHYVAISPANEKDFEVLMQMYPNIFVSPSIEEGVIHLLRVVDIKNMPQA